MDIENRSWERENQTELPEPIKVRFTGKLRDTINQRQAEYAGLYPDGEPEEDTEVYVVSQARPFHRQDTNVVIETEEEAYSVLSGIQHYSYGGGKEGVTWMNGPMVKAAKRVESEIRNQLDEMGVEINK